MLRSALLRPSRRLLHQCAAARQHVGDTRSDVGGFFEYIPSDKDDRQLGEYQEVPFVSAQMKYPFQYENWQHRRNWNEPLHEDADILSMWVTEQRQPVETSTMLKWLAGAMFSVLALRELLDLTFGTEPVANVRELVYHDSQNRPKDATAVTPTPVAHH